MDRKNFYYDQDLSHTNLNDIQTNVEEAFKAMVLDLFGFGIVSGLDVTITEESSLNVKVAAGVAYAVDGSRLLQNGDINVDITQDWNGESTEVVEGGETRWVTLYIYPSYVLNDQRVDGKGESIFFNWTEGSLIRVVKGEVGGGTPTDPVGGGLVLADIRRYATQRFVETEDINTDRQITVERDVSGHRVAIPIDHPDESIPISKLMKTGIPPEYLDREYIPIKGGTIEGTIDMDNFKLLNLPTPTLPRDPATKEYTDKIITSSSFNVTSHKEAVPIDHPDKSIPPNALDRLYLEASGGTMYGVQDMNGYRLENVGYPADKGDGANADYANDVAQGAILFDTAQNKQFRIYVASGSTAVEEIDPYIPVAPRTWLTPAGQTVKSYILHVTSGVLATEEVAYLGKVRGLIFEDRVVEGDFYELLVDTSGVLSLQLLT